MVVQEVRRAVETAQRMGRRIFFMEEWSFLSAFGGL
jgi:hypothetical protein